MTLLLHSRNFILRVMMILILLPGLAATGWGQTTVVINPESPWTVPSGVTLIKVEVWGGGGAGGGAYIGAGGGGSGASGLFGGGNGGNSTGRCAGGGGEGASAAYQQSSFTGGSGAPGQVIITYCPNLAVTVTSQSNVSCYGGNDGSINISASGGDAPYSFSLDNGQTYVIGDNDTQKTFTGLESRVYHLRVKEANGFESQECL
jgi:hypothetical protein